MQLYLNHEQSKGLANFFFDLGKGVFLGSIGIVMISEAKIIFVSLGMIFVMLCIFQALSLLGKID